MVEKSNILYNFINHTVWDFIIYRGLLALIIGILFVAVPGITVDTICLLLGIFLLLNGLAAIIKAIRERHSRKIILTYGIIFLLAGILVLLHPVVIKRLLIILFSLWIIISGGNQLAAAWKAKVHPLAARILTVLIGVISILLGLGFLIYPDIGLNLVVMIIGIYFITFGVLAVTIGSFIHKANRNANTIVG